MKYPYKISNRETYDCPNKKDMKKLIVAIISLLITISVSCEKEVIEKPDNNTNSGRTSYVDYRLKWVGDYICQKESDYQDTRTVLLHITLADGDSLLNINEEKMNAGNNYMDLKAKVDSYGDMWCYSGINALDHNFMASFYADSIYVRYYLLCGHNYAPRYVYKGQKINEK